MDDFRVRAFAALQKAGVFSGEKGKCQQCGHHEFLVVRHMLLPPLEGPASSWDRVPSVPCVGVICKSCGNLRLFSAGYLGLLGPEAASDLN